MSTDRRQHLLGLIFQTEGLLGPEQVQHVVAEQTRLRQGDTFLPFGQVAQDLGLIDENALDWALELQLRLSVAAEERKRLGFYLLEANVVKPSALMAALDTQKEGGGLLGSLLVQRGELTSEQLDVILSLQEWGHQSGQ